MSYAYAYTPAEARRDRAKVRETLAAIASSIPFGDARLKIHEQIGALKAIDEMEQCQPAEPDFFPPARRARQGGLPDALCDGGPATWPAWTDEHAWVPTPAESEADRVAELERLEQADRDAEMDRIVRHFMVP